jgi:CDP-paratose 2-epimerase
MPDVLITGSAGLVGSEAVRFFCEKGFRVVGVDNNMRRYFFGDDADTTWNKKELLERYSSYRHCDADIRDEKAMGDIFRSFSFDLVIHAAAQPSHDWAAREPFTDFTVNANGTLVLLECLRTFCPEAVFIFFSTNKVYGDRPNFLPLVEKETRYELPEDHPFHKGIDESMSIDNCTHSLFGASKVAADILVQEYGKYFGLKTVVFRGGCLTGPAHSGTRLHGFLSYLMRSCISGRKYSIYGYKGKQVRDNIHARDLVSALYHFYLAPRPGEVYNMGGGRQCSVSLLEAIALCEDITGKLMEVEYTEENRAGDHQWWITDTGKFRKHYPAWAITYSVPSILKDIFTTQGKLLREDAQ